MKADKLTAHQNKKKENRLAKIKDIQDYLDLARDLFSELKRGHEFGQDKKGDQKLWRVKKSDK